MNPEPTKPRSREEIERTAAQWVLRRDRGLTATEQDELSQWLAEDSRHGEALALQRWGWDELDRLAGLQTSLGAVPNPDLFAPRRRVRWWPWAASAALAAATVALSLIYSWHAPAAPAVKSYLQVNERLALPDGSRIELKDGSKVVVQYSDRERRVKLTGGEAQFSVWQDATRPFVVEAGGIEVRAVGTVFNVRLENRAVEVLVTEGRVKVNREPLAATAGGSVADVMLAAGEQTAVPLAVDAVQAAPVVVPATSEQISQSLAWQTPRLQFFETPHYRVGRCVSTSEPKLQPQQVRCHI